MRSPDFHRWGAVAVSLLAACTFDPSASLTGGNDDDDDTVPPADAGAVPPDASAGTPDARPPQPPTPDAATPPLPSGSVLAPFDNRIVADGDLSEWSDHEFLSMNMASADHVHLNYDSYQPSARMQFAAAHDAVYLYLAIIVTDDVIMYPPETLENSYRLWDDDSVSIWLDLAGDRSGPLAADDYEVIVSANGRYAQSPQTPHLTPKFTILGAARPSPGGYILEIGLEKTSFGLDVLPETIGFSIGINDDDGDNPSTGNDAIGVWHMTTPSACPDCCNEHADPWCDTSTLGTLHFQ